MRPRTVFCSFLRKYCFFRKKLFNMKIFSVLFSIKKVIFILSVSWPLFLKNGHVPRKFFSPIFSKNVAFLKKLLNKKIFETSFPIKKFYVHFLRQTPPSLQKRLGPQKRFLPFSQKIQLVLKKLLNNKIFSASFVIKKVMLIFGARPLISLKNCQMCSQNSFTRFWCYCS